MLLLQNVLSFMLLLLELFLESSAVEPTGTSTVRSYKLEFFEKGEPWKVSQKLCEGGDSWLVEIKDEEIYSAVMTLKKHHIIWIGVYYLKEWAWNGSIPIRYENWRNAYPSTVGSIYDNYCGSMQEDGSWINIDCKKGYRYICQSDLTSGQCTENLCSNRGTCNISNERFVCSCKSGYFGTKCEKDLITISVEPKYVTLNKGESIEVTLTTKSYDGNIIVSYESDTGKIIGSETFFIQRPGNLKTGKRSLGIQLQNVTYYLGASPISKTYSRNDTISITIIDHCASTPCMNGGTCSYALSKPYYTCACSFEYEGLVCEGNRSFVTSGNCKYHMKNDSVITSDNAAAMCKKLGGSLTMIKTSQIQEFLQQEFAAKFGDEADQVWVGGHRDGQVWYWTDGTEINLTSPWQDFPESEQKVLAISLPSSSSKIRWNSKRKSESANGYMCEAPVQDPCAFISCFNTGNCVVVGCQGNCNCTPGFSGDLCQIDRIVISADRLNYTTIQNQNVDVSLSISSNHGSVKIEVYKGSFSAGVFLTQRNITDSTTFNTGPMMNQTEGLQYIFKATPESDPRSYYKFISVTVIVQGPPSIASIRDNVLSLPTETSIVVQCNASGVPRPNIAWKKDGVEVNTIGSNPVYQTKGVKFSNLNFKSDARTEVGHYTCYADNEIGNGEKKSVHESIFVGGKINLVGNTTKNPESAFDTITLSCTFEGYPAPNIFWKLGDGKKIPLNNTGSIFTIHTVVQSDLPLVRKKSSLHITLVEFLGARNVSCHSRNTYGNNTGARFSLNENLLIGNNRSYRLYAGNNEKMNYYDALTYCKDSRRSLVKILDNKTQYFIADQLSTINLTTKILIGAQKQYMRAVKLWKWFDGKIFYNESKYGSGQNVYPNYSAWHGDKPNGIGNCAVLNLDSQWLWTPESCNLANGFICESEVAGVPRDLEVMAEICRSNVNVSWVAAKEAVGVMHRIELHKVIGDSFSRVVSTQEVIPDKVGRFATHFFSLEKGTLYIVKVIVCPECPYPHTTSATVSTNELIPASTYEIASATVVQVMQSCVLSWSVNASAKGIFAYRITISTTLIHSASAKGRSWSAREVYEIERGQSIHKYSVSAQYNRKYTFSVQIRTCLNLGRPTEIVGSCLVERGPPSSVPQPITQVGNDGKPIVEIAIPDETNGPISCLFIVVIRGVSAIKNTNFGRTVLTNAMVNAKSETLLENDAYIAIAISRQDISAVIEQGINLTRSFGDAGAVSSCDIAADYSKRKKRSTTATDVFEGRNRDLPAGKSFGIITISTTPGDNGEVFFQTSERSLQYLMLSTVPSGLGSAAAPIIVLSSLLLISLIAIAVQALKLKNMKAQLALKEEKFQSNEEYSVRPYETTFVGSKIQQYENPDTTGRIEKPISHTEESTSSVGDQNPYEIAQCESEAQSPTYEVPRASQVNANSPYEEVRL